MMKRLLLTACLILMVGCATSTPTPTITPTSRPPRPTATPEPPPLLSLPAGFDEVDPAEYGLSVESLAQPGIEINKLVAYEGPQDAVVFGFWGQVTRQAETAGTLLDDPSALIDSFLRGYGADASEATPINPDVGDRATGFELDPLTVIAFQRDDTVAVLTAINFDDLLSVAQQLDERLSTQ